MATQIALLRGINVGKTKRMAMADLRGLMEELGFTDVRTYVQSGNVVFSGPARGARGKIERGIAARFGFEVPVMVRTEEQLAAIVAANPFKGVADNPKAQLVNFLSAAPAAGALDGLDPADYAPEAWVLDGTELHVWCANGIIESKLLKILTEKRLGVTVTNRNWRTVEALLAMARGEA